jgi:hypothetical protein
MVFIPSLGLWIDAKREGHSGDGLVLNSYEVAHAGLALSYITAVIFWRLRSQMGS